jgi:DNA polymerase-3 subunit beta
VSFHARLEVKDLRRAMALVTPVVARSPTAPILHHALLRASGNTLTVIASDQIHEVEATVPCEEGEGETTVSATRLDDLAKRLLDGAQVDLREKEGSVEAKSGRSRVALLTLPASDFPILPREEASGFTIAGADFVELLSRVQHAQATNDTREYLKGTYLHVADGRLCAAASTGFILAMRDFPLPADAGKFEGVLMGRTAVALALRVVGGAADVRISPEKERVTISNGTARLTARLIDGLPAPYAAMLPDLSTNDGILVDLEELKRAVSIASIVLESTKAGLAVAFDEGKLSVSLADHAAGEASQEISAELRNCPPGRFYVGAALFQSVLSGCSFDTARMVFRPDRKTVTLVSAAAQFPYAERHLIAAKDF